MGICGSQWTPHFGVVYDIYEDVSTKQNYRYLVSCKHTVTPSPSIALYKVYDYKWYQGRDVHELERKNAIERDSIKNLTSRGSTIYKPNIILLILVPVFIMSLPN